MTRVIRADQHGPRIVPRAVVDATEQAHAILVSAREQAQTILAQAEHEAAERAERAADQGRAQAREQAASLLHSCLESLTHAREQLPTTLEPQVIEVALLAARHIVGSELAARPAAIADIVRPLLQRLRRAHTVVLRVHPADGEWLQSALSDLQRQTGVNATLRLELDPELERGGCMASSEVGALDARLESRLGVLQDMLRKTIRSDVQ